MMKQMDNRAYNAGEGMSDSPDSVKRAGGEAGMDPRRVDAKIAIDRVVRDQDMSGYNHNATSTQPSNRGNENVMYANEKDMKAKAMGTLNPDGTYNR